MPSVRVVTPGSASTMGIGVLKDELENALGWKNVANWSWKVYSVIDLGISLASCAADAVQDNPDVIVTAGTMATNAVLPLTGIPVIQAVGGALPANPKMNVTGFVIDAKQISQANFAKLAANHATVTVLYDGNNGPSADAYQALLLYQQTYFAGVAINPNNVSQYPVTPNQLNIQVSFMLIPNANYHLAANLKTIVKAVAQAGVPAIYPEREYKKAHNHRAGILVHGHNVTATYRVAASYVDSVLDGTMDASSLPPFKEAMIDKHEDI